MIAFVWPCDLNRDNIIIPKINIFTLSTDF